MERPQEFPKNLPGVGVIALHNLTVRDHYSKKMNEDECEDTGAEGVLEIPVIDTFGVLLGSIRLKCSHKVELRAGCQRSVQRYTTPRTDHLYIVSCDFEFWTVLCGR